MGEILELGTIVLAKYFNGVSEENNTSQYQQKLVENFTNVGMFAFGQMPFITKNGPNPEKDYDWKNIDSLVEWGLRNDVEVQYNTLMNSHPNSFPEWYYRLSRAERKSAIKKYIQAVLRRYKDKIKWYKLVNESKLYDQDYLGTGEKRVHLIAEIFTTAKEEYPKGKFVLNDHIPFLKQDQSVNQFIKLIKEVITLDVPIDAIGIEGHLGYRPIPFQLPTDDEIIFTLDRIHDISGLPIYITEFDLSYDNAPTNPYPGSKIDPAKPFVANQVKYKNWFEYQAYAYKHFYDLCKGTDYIRGLTFWGFTDKDWPSWERPGVGFFDENFKPKPAFLKMKEVILQSYRPSL